MNNQIASVTVTYRDGRVSQLEHINIRGSKIRFKILPDMLKNAPMLKNMGGRGGGRGGGGAPRGKSGILGAQARGGGRGSGEREAEVVEVWTLQTKLLCLRWRHTPARRHNELSYQ